MKSGSKQAVQKQHGIPECHSQLDWGKTNELQWL